VFKGDPAYFERDLRALSGGDHGFLVNGDL
jgi:hypothetical protein